MNFRIGKKKSRELISSHGGLMEDSGRKSPSSPVHDQGVVDSSRVLAEQAVGFIEHLTVPRKLAYSVGHVLNDLAASMWFTYFILFYHMVLRISNAYAGLLVLIGQVADAMATPVIGYLCDNTNNRYGGRKTFHLIGAIMVGVSLFFFWHECIYCNEQPMKYQLIYFASFIIVFQWGWATVQVSHLALIPELTSDENERVGLTSLRYSATIFSNLGVFVVIFVLLASVNRGKGFTGFSAGSKLSPADQWIFSGIALGMIGLGSVFVFLYHIGTKEPYRNRTNTSSTLNSNKLPVYKWFLNPQFYLVGVIYMSSRLIVNLTQVYSPLYILDTIGMSRLSVAIFPLVIFLSGLGTSFVLKKLNKAIGRYIVYFIGLIFVLCASLWFRFWPKIETTQHSSPSAHNDTNHTTLNGETELGTLHIHPLPDYEYTANLIYVAAILTGIGGTTLLVTSLSMVADLIGKHSGSSAFVYGAMSFTDKLSNGIAIQLIQLLHPCKGSGQHVCCKSCAPYYRRVVSYAPGGACVIALVGLVLVVIWMQLKSNGVIVITESRLKYNIQDRNTSAMTSSSDETAPLIKNN